MLDTIKQMRAAVLNAPGQDGVLLGLVTLLEAAPDSSMIVTGLTDIDPNGYQDNQLKSRVATLLREAGEADMGDHWDPKIARPVAANAPNVVDFGAVRAVNDEIVHHRMVKDLSLIHI